METTVLRNDRLKDGFGGGRDYGIVVFSHLRWDFVWQRPQQFLSRFAKTKPILFLEEPFYDLPEGTQAEIGLHEAQENITVACPHFASGADATDVFAGLKRLTKEAIERVNSGGEFDRPLLWFYNPMDAAWALDYFEERGVVYDCMDELSQFAGAPASLVKNEAKLLAAADIVFTGGFELWLKKQEKHDNVHFFGCGVEYAHFAKAQDPATEVPEDIKNLGGPVLGWFGVIDERMDYDLVAEMASQRPDWQFAMVGPVVKVDESKLPRLPNIHWLGQRDYKVLPNYCKGFDVCMMCFAINEATEYINPTKALEYMATGKPVVSTPVRDVVRQYAEYVSIAETPSEFVAAAEKAITEPDEKRLRKGIEKAASASWEATVEKMSDLIAEAVANRSTESLVGG